MAQGRSQRRDLKGRCKWLARGERSPAFANGGAARGTLGAGVARPAPGRDGIGWRAHGPPAAQQILFGGAGGLIDAQARCLGERAGWPDDEPPAQAKGGWVGGEGVGGSGGEWKVEGSLYCLTHRRFDASY